MSNIHEPSSVETTTPRQSRRLDDFYWFTPGVTKDGVDLGDLVWTERHLERLLPWGRSTIFELVRTDRFPRPVLLPTATSTRRVWLRHDVLSWVEHHRSIATSEHPPNEPVETPPNSARAEVAEPNLSGASDNGTYDERLPEPGSPEKDLPHARDQAPTPDLPPGWTILPSARRQGGR